VKLSTYHRVIPALHCLPLGMCGAVLAWMAVRLRFYHCDLLVEKLELAAIFDSVRAPVGFLSLMVISAIVAVMSLAAAFSGLLSRSVRSLGLIRKANAALLAYYIFYAWAVFSTTSRVEDAVRFGESAPNAIDVFYWRLDYLWLPSFIAVGIAWLHLNAWRRVVMNFYTGDAEAAPARGDQIVENIRTHGGDPEYRKSKIGSVWSHILVIVIIPWLFNLFGCVRPYKIPFGGGEPAVMQVVQFKKKPKKKREYILSLDTAILFNLPDLDESKIFQEVEILTRLTYEANAKAAHGKLGSKTASQAGFWDGFLDGEMRFIRLEYNGSDWDDGMDGTTQADMNFLLKFREVSGGMKTALRGESHRVRLLKKYPKGQAPPFVYMTGSGSINMSGSDIKILREHLRGGGLLFADCGSPAWHGSFRSFVSRLFPGKQLSVIADDDPIFQLPFAFPNGAPPLWHHGGQRALGIKEGGRWLVFYHPGDVNDAWKTGHSGIDSDLAEGAFQVGINVVYYSTMRYLEKTRKYRKKK
jgi:hypothetical protein